MSKKLIAFDLDDTLAVTKSPITDEMGQILVKLLEKYEVCIISGGKFEQFKTQVIDRLESNHLNLRKLHIMPTCGTRYYRYDEIEEKWQKQYAEDFTTEQKAKIIATIEEEAKKLKMWESKTWGDIIEDRGSQITYSALGQLAPPKEKYAWADKNVENKKVLKENISRVLSDLEVRLGGSTSIDITRIGIDKAYGMQKLIDEMDISKEDILFIGDRLEEGGNDYPVKAMGIDCIAVSKWEETPLIIQTLIYMAQ